MTANDPTVSGRAADAARVAIVYHSGYGHTARQAAAVAEGAGAVPGIHVGLHSVDEADERMWAALQEADAIVFGSPTYMGGASAAFRAFAERTGRLMEDGLRWRDKIAAGFTCSGSMSGDKLNTLTGLAVFAAQHGMIWVGLAQRAGWNSSRGSVEDLNRLGGWLGALAQADADQPAELVPPETDLRTARELGRRVAEVTLVHRRGRANGAAPGGLDAAREAALAG
jgi:multimeric flavodoxin WrbA